MVKKRSVKDFVNEYNKFSSDTLKQNHLKSVIITDKYVDFLVKCGMAETIIKQSHYDNNRKHKVNSSKKYLLYLTALLEMYTNLDIQAGNAIEDYNLLNKNNMIEPLLALMPSREVAEFETIVQMYADDDCTNYVEIHHFISNEVLPTIAGTISPMTDALSVAIEKITDDGVMTQILEKIQQLK